MLATDIKHHFKMLKKIDERIGLSDFLPTDFNPFKEDFYLVLEAFTHTADLYIPSLELDKSLQWTKMVNSEFMA